MHSQLSRDVLSLAAITALSLAMMGAGYAIWRSLRERSIHLAALDARNLELLTGMTLAFLGLLVMVWLVLLLVVALLARLAVVCGKPRRSAALTAVLPSFMARMALAGLGGSLLLSGCSATATAVPVPVAAMAIDSTPRPVKTAQTAHTALTSSPAPEGNAAARIDQALDPAPVAYRASPEAKAPPGQPSELLSPGFIPHRVPLPLARVAGAATRAGEEIVVREGDSLWAIAARHLSGGAGAEEIAAEWPRWYAQNRGVIGPNPHLLSVGMVLHAPPSASPAS